jgi:hypothetical protein
MMVGERSSRRCRRRCDGHRAGSDRPVGWPGGLPNEEGVVQLDASCMQVPPSEQARSAH